MRAAKIFLCAILISFSVPAFCEKAVSFSVQGSKKQYSKMKSLFVCSTENRDLLKLSKIVSDDLNFTDQFDVSIKKTNIDFTEKIMASLFKDGFSLCISFKENKKPNHVDVEVKDTSSNITVYEKTVSYDGKKVVTQGHELANDLLLQFTGEKGVCLSSLAYCKMMSPRHKVVCISDYACNTSSVVVPTKLVNIAPSWHTKNEVLFYSQLTKTNNRLMSVDLKTNKKKVVCSYNGLNMQPSFSEDGSKVIICLSGGKGNSELYLYDEAVCKKMGKRVFKQVTGNRANNVSPCLLPDGNILLCSDYGSGQPQIYYLNNTTKTMRRLTGGRGYCAAPSYCKETNKVMYTRPVNGTFQLFVLSLDNLDNVKEQQITFGEGNKHEPSWSECGQYAVFSMDTFKNKRRVPQISMLNCRSGKIRVLTHGSEPKSFPRWGKHQFSLLCR